MNAQSAKASRAVFVTGATSGIGLATARLLASEGFNVFAGVEPGEDPDGLDGTGAELVTIDVTDAASLAAARDGVRAHLGDTPLWGLVNCAGVIGGGAVEKLDMAEVRRVFEVNVLGLFAVCQTFLPQIRAAKGRIVNISSLSGLLAVPFLGPYCASKAAVESLCDTMRRELQPLGVDVIAIQPGKTRTSLWSKAKEFDLSPYQGSGYESAITALRRKAAKKERKGKGQPPLHVAQAVLRGLTAEPAPSRIRVQRNRAGNLFYSLLPLLPDRIVDRKVTQRIWRK
ncbi:MAG: SDR family oxidoreductase [Paracoccaceae bacterium]